MTSPTPENPGPRPAGSRSARRGARPSGSLGMVLGILVLLLLSAGVKAVNPPAVSVRLLDGFWSPPSSDGASDLPRYRVGESMRLRITADRDGRLYVFRWAGDVPMELLELDGRTVRPVQGWISDTLPEPAAPLVVTGRPGVAALIVLNCPAVLEPARLEQVARAGTLLHPGTSELSVMDVAPAAAVSGCAAFAAGYEIRGER